jgi:parallel beta-helix repeat protein
LPLNTKPAWIKLIPLIALLAGTGCQKAEVTELAKQTIDQDTTWSGTVVINGDVYVPPGVTLTIAPGTVVKFKKIDEKSDQNLFDIDSPYYPEAELIIRGRLIARGTKDKQIVFTSAEMRPNPADWGAINFLGSEGNVVEYAKVYCAYNGIHAHGSAVRVTNSEFARNGVGISFKKEEEAPDVPWFGRPSDLTITNSVFSKNKGAIGCRNSTAEILHNEIRENKFFGIWPKEDCPAVIRYNEITDNDRGIYLYQVQGMVLEQNNIYNNRSYDIAIAEAQDFPVSAPYNWFGTTDPAKIAEKLFDKNDDPEVAEIQIQPLLDKPVQWKNK